MMCEKKTKHSLEIGAQIHWDSVIFVVVVAVVVVVVAVVVVVSPRVSAQATRVSAQATRVSLPIFAAVAALNECSSH